MKIDTPITMTEKYVTEKLQSVYGENRAPSHKNVLNVFKEGDVILLNLSISSGSMDNRQTVTMPLRDLSTDNGWKQWTDNIDRIISAKVF